MRKTQNPQKKPMQKTNHPREHWTRKKGKWKSKKDFQDVDSANLYIKKHKMTKYNAYMCPFCGKIHIGFITQNKNSTK